MFIIDKGVLILLCRIHTIGHSDNKTVDFFPTKCWLKLVLHTHSHTNVVGNSDRQERGDVQHNEPRKSSMILSMCRIFVRRNCIQTIGISIKNFSRRKIWEPALKFLLSEIPTEKVRWGLHTVGNFWLKTHIKLFLSEIPIACTQH